MPYVQQYMHLVFRTDRSQHFLTERLKSELFPYMRGIAKQFGINVLSMNGVPDHMHMLVTIPARLSLSECVQNLKGRASRWINKRDIMPNRFAWQEGYGGFSVSPQNVQRIIRYIERQQEHHTIKTHRDELKTMLDAHGLQPSEYDSLFYPPPRVETRG